MILLKACPRCQGDLQVNRDFYGEYKECIQCGYMEDLDGEPISSEPTVAESDRRIA